MEIESLIMTIISSSGEAKALCYEALDDTLQGRMKTALSKIARAEALLRAVHESHRNLFSSGLLPSDPKMMLLLVHAEDIFMSTMTEKELIKTMARAGRFGTGMEGGREQETTPSTGREQASNGDPEQS